MSKLFFFFSLFLYQQSSAQLVVDSLKTEADVKAFVNNSLKDHVLVWDSLKSQKWIIEDFNNDGRQDIVWHGVFKYYSKDFFSFISKGTREYEYTDLQKSNLRYSPFDFEACKKENHSLLVIRSNKLEFRNNKEIKRGNIDTLLYKNGGFIEWHTKKHKPFDFDSLKFSSHSFGMSPASFYPDFVSISISKNNIVKYKETRSQLIGSVSEQKPMDISFECITTIEEKYRIELNSLLSDISILDAKDSFAVLGSHFPEGKLKIFTGSKIKQIYDYGEEGSYGLMLLYKKLFAIMKRIRDYAAKRFNENDYWDD